jgi:hypothetical protein
MAAEHRPIRENDMGADDTVMTDMRIHHEKVVIANDGCLPR